MIWKISKHREFITESESDGDEGDEDIEMDEQYLENSDDSVIDVSKFWFSVLELNHLKCFVG